MILIADLHFGNEKDSFDTPEHIPSQRRDLRNTLQYIGEMARDTGQALVMAGDIFNRVNPTTEVIAEFFSFLNRFPTVQMFLIPGNHDASTTGVNMAMVQAAAFGHVRTFLKPKEVLVSDTTGSAEVLFYPHIPLANRDGVKTIEGWWTENTKFAVTHGQVTGLDYTNDIFFEAGDALPIDLTKLPGLVFAGHIHTYGSHMNVDNKRGAVVYPGSLTINNFGEVDEKKGYLSVPLDNPSKAAHLETPSDFQTRWQHVELDLTEKDEDSLDVEAIKDVSKGAIIKITVLAKEYNVVNEAYVRSLFNKYGRVVRYETKVPEHETEVTVRPTMSHEKLLSQWLDGKKKTPAKMRKMAMTVGAKIIGEVLE